MPVPRGAGIKRTDTEPHLPVTWAIDETKRKQKQKKISLQF